MLYALPGLAIRYDDAALEWSRDEGRVNLIITGARVFDGDRHIIAQAPKAEIGLAAQALVWGNVQVQRITLVGVQLTLVRTQDGALHLGVERNKTHGDVLERIRDALEKAGTGASSLQRVAVSQAKLAFYDEPTGLFVVAPQARVEVASDGRNNNRLVANLDAAIEITGQPARLTGQIKLLPNGGHIVCDLSVTRLSLPALARNSPQFTFLTPYNLRTDLSGSFVIEHANRLRSADISISATGAVNAFGTSVPIDSLKLVGRYDALTGKVLIDGADIKAEDTAAHFQGSGDLHFANDGSLEQANLDISSDRIYLAMQGAFARAVELGGAHLRATYSPANETFSVEQLALQGPALSGALSGQVVLEQNASPAINATGTLKELSATNLVRYWPLRMGEGARSWIAANMPAGQIGPISVAVNIKAGDLDKPALPEQAVHLNIPVQNASVKYLKGMTLLTHTNGTGILTGDTFKVQVTSGRVGTIALRNGAVTIPELHKHGTVGDIAVSLQGQLRDLLTILDEKPLQYPSRFHIKATEAAGTTIVDADFHVPMVKDVGIDRIPIKVEGKVSGMGLSLGPNTRLSNGNLAFDIDNVHLHAAGTINYGSTPVVADWTELFSSKNPNTTTLKVRAHLDEEARDLLKLHLSDVLSGPVDVTATLTGSHGNIRYADVNIDLTPATLAWNVISYMKNPGVPANAQISANLDANGDIQAANVLVAGAGLAGRGTLNFRGDGGISHAEFPMFRAGPQNDFSLSLFQTAPKTFDVAIRGRSADGSSFAKRNSNAKTAEQPSSNRYHLVARLERVVLAEGTVLTPFSLDANTISDSIQDMSVSTGMSKTDTVTASIVPAADGRKLTLGATDAGLLLKGLFGLKDISGGKLNLIAKMPPVGAAKGSAADYAGTLTIQNFRIENQPFFSRLFSAGSLGGLIDLMRGAGIVIDKLEMPFSSKNDVINIQDGHASGPSVGFSGDGYIDRRANTIDLRGAIAPIYGLNSVLGALPILGNMLVSKQGEGIIGMTYEASGSLDEPKISVNPLSILTPGIFRRIFEGKVPTAPSQANKTPSASAQTPH
ncbi:MAG TPA: AsmA-like C-terminal domain-containing protein [Rhizomicrobium sp.]|nr:AsmA-like C-terminal domain-containing protein [Rhizomicrobium sp.]